MHNFKIRSTNCEHKQFREQVSIGVALVHHPSWNYFKSSAPRLSLSFPRVSPETNTKVTSGPIRLYVWLMACGVTEQRRVWMLVEFGSCCDSRTCKCWDFRYVLTYVINIYVYWMWVQDSGISYMYNVHHTVWFWIQIWHTNYVKNLVPLSNPKVRAKTIHINNIKKGNF